MNKPVPRTILIVDDQPENLSLLTQLLQPHYRVRAARSGEQALRAADMEPRPDLVLLDVMMPDMDGYAVLERMQTDPAMAATPVIFITALAAEEDEEKGLALGAVDYITKPIQPALVLARVRTHVELKAARDSLADQNAILENQVAQRTEALKHALGQLEGAHANLRKTYFDTLMAISELASLRDSDIAHHARRVADISRQVAFRMGMDAGDAQDVFIAALLHDVGTIGYPDGMLKKSVSAFNRDEIDIYRRHPAQGAEIINRISSLSGIANIILHHHEYYDGSGFPEGLSGLDIPQGSRIIFPISDYEDLCNGRLTAQPMTPRQACQYLVAEQGARYDPLVIQTLEPVLAAELKFQIDEVLVAVKHLHENMLVTQDVLHGNGFILLSKGTVLNRRLIDQLVAVEQQTGSALRVMVSRASMMPRQMDTPSVEGLS